MVRQHVAHRQPRETVVSSDLPDLRTILTGRAHVLLDFDGPVCAVYWGWPAAEVAATLRKQLRAELAISLPDDSDDPLDVLRDVRTRAPDSSPAAHGMLTALEIEAVKSARPAPATDELISTARSSGRTVTVVSNNSAHAISRYCLDHGLGDWVTHIIGRDPDTALMKPDPHLINLALATLRAKPAEAVFIGDSPSDIAAGHLAGVPVIGYANKPGKGSRLVESGADAVTGSLLHISAALVDTKA